MTGFGKFGHIFPPQKDVANFYDSLSDISTTENDTGSIFKKKKSSPDRWVVDVGRNYRVQVAAIMLFNLASEYANAIRESWANVIFDLFSNSMNLFLLDC